MNWGNKILQALEAVAGEGGGAGEEGGEEQGGDGGEEGRDHPPSL